MITREQARILVAAKVAGPREWLPDDDEIVIVDESTIERHWGWVFFYTSRRWLETGEIQYALGGNSPLIVERSTGRILETGSALHIDAYIANYERTVRPHG
jgi:hypothetical protein